MVALPPDPGKAPPNPEDDPFKPPVDSVRVRCMHCSEEYDSSGIKYVNGFWRCPIGGCDGAGFCFDIWPIDPEWRDEDGNKVWFDDAEDDEDSELDDELGLLGLSDLDDEDEDAEEDDLPGPPKNPGSGPDDKPIRRLTEEDFPDIPY